MVLRDGGAAIRVRTVMRRPMKDRWNADEVKNITPTPRQPNPKDVEQDEAMPERLSRGPEVGEDGSALHDAATRDRSTEVRNFRITKRLLQEYGYTPSCRGCEASILGRKVESGWDHTVACRSRIEERMRADEYLKQRLDERDSRLKKSRNVGGAVKSDDPPVSIPVEVVREVDSGIAAEGNLEDGTKAEDEEMTEETGAEATTTSPTDEPIAEDSERRGAKRQDADTPEVESKRRRIKLLESERRVMNNCHKGKLIGTSRMALNRLLNDLESGGRIGDAKAHAEDISNIIGAVQREMPTPHEEEEEQGRWDRLYDKIEFLDDMNGFKPLVKEKVVAARVLEMEYFRKMGVYHKVTREEARRNGCKVLTTKWLDTNKGDEVNVNYRSRLVGRELKMDNRLDLFAATPPLETLKLLLSMCAKGQQERNPLRLAVIDIKRAYFYAPATRPVFIEIPKEDRRPGDEGKIARLNLSLYGTRDAAQNWTAEYTKFLQSLGFRVGKASTCNFTHTGRSINLTVHGDDFAIVGPAAQIGWLSRKMQERYDIKLDVLGPDEGQQREVKILNRILRWTDGGLEYEADQRHAELLIKEMGLQGSKSAVTPSIPETSEMQELRADEELLSEAEASRYRGIAARINYLAIDRPDIQFACKGACRWMARPVNSCWNLLKRIVRYLSGAPRIVQLFEWDNLDSTLTGFADSDWAGDKKTLKSTSGGAIVWGTHTLKTWSTSQSTIALSSGEAELYALTKAATQLVGISSLAMDFGVETKGVVRTDSSAAMGMTYRTGLGGRCRHIKVQYLWIQQAVRSGDLSLTKVAGTENPADLMTKSVPADLAAKHLVKLGFLVVSGRSDKASRLQACTKRELVNSSDYWLKRDDQWIRAHVKPRMAMFTPMKVAGGPTSRDLIGKYRHTFGVEDGYAESYRIQEWNNKANPNERVLRGFTGVTLFSDSPDTMDSQSRDVLLQLVLDRGGVQEYVSHYSRNEGRHDRTAGTEGR